jgi:acetyltransferase-like isoleucine patch superfamily enzyme
MYDLDNDRQIGPTSIGRGTYWHPTTSFLTYTPSETITIGRYCSIAADVTICSGGEHHLSTVSTWPFDNFLRKLPNPTRTYRPIRDVVIGSDVWIGHGAHIAGGARIGHGAVIGARAVVTSDVPPYAIVVGNRSEIVRFRFSESDIAQLLKIAWWDWPPAKIVENVDLFYADVSEFIARHASP